jgi:hypothetical protein
LRRVFRERKGPTKHGLDCGALGSCDYDTPMSHICYEGTATYPPNCSPSFGATQEGGCSRKGIAGTCQVGFITVYFYAGHSYVDDVPLVCTRGTFRGDAGSAPGATDSGM